MWRGLLLALGLAAGTPAFAAEPPPAAAPAPAATGNDPAPAVTTPPPAPAAPGSDPGAGPEPALLARHAAGRLGPDFITLGGDAAAFLARYAPAAREPGAGAILYVAAPGVSVATDAAVAAELDEFARSDWAVLVPQMPLLPRTFDMSAYAATEDAALERLRAARAYLDEQGYEKIVMVGEDSGASLLRRGLIGGVGDDAHAFVVLGHWDGTADDLDMPVLEIYAERDAVAGHLAEVRARAVRKAGKKDYEQLTVLAAGMRYPGFEDDVARRVHGWAQRVMAAAPAPAENPAP